ncbi:MAG: outer membrane lipoprotein-sorting protein [Pseudomonadota bacterium]
MSIRALSLAFGACALFAAFCAAAADAVDVMEKNFMSTKLVGFSGDVTLRLVDARGDVRVRKMSVRSRLRDNGVDSAVMTRFAQPADIKGTGFLQIENRAADDDIWVYLPALGKTRRLAANNKRDSFFGTDFAYGDILLPAVEQYRHKLLRQEKIDGSDCYVIESTPGDAKTRADTGYSRRIIWVDTRSYVERKVEYYDPRGTLLKTQTTYDLKQVDPAKNRWLPMRRQMVNHQTRHSTLYQFDRFDLRTDLLDANFTVRKLEEE